MEQLTPEDYKLFMVIIRTISENFLDLKNGGVYQYINDEVLYTLNFKKEIINGRK